MGVFFTRMHKGVTVEHAVMNRKRLLKKLFKKTHDMALIDLIGLYFFNQFMSQFHRKLSIMFTVGVRFKIKGLFAFL